MSVRRHVLSLPSGLLALMFALLACADGGEDAGEEAGGEAGEEAAEGGEGTEIVLWDGQWESLWINNAIAEIILTEGYGYDVSTAQVSTPIMQQSIVQGDVHVAVEMWCINHQAWCDESASAGDIDVLGTQFEQAEQGWYVPTYLIEGDAERDIEPLTPDLAGVEDLPQYADVFADGGSTGVLTAGIADWEVTETSIAKAYAYDLDESYEVQTAGSSAALDAAITGAMDRGEPTLFYYWAPSWLLAEYDVTLLNEPEATEECEEALAAAVESGAEQAPPEAGCAFPAGEVEVGAWPGLVDMAPELVTFFEAMHIGDDAINAAQAFMILEEVEPEEAAMWYLQNHDDWHEWIAEDDVLERVQEAVGGTGA